VLPNGTRERFLRQISRGQAGLNERALWSVVQGVNLLLGTIVVWRWWCSNLNSRFLPQGFDGIDDPEPVADAGDTHPFQCDLIQFEENIASDVVGLECVSMVPALDIY
jgi:hypothetical protein